MSFAIFPAQVPRRSLGGNPIFLHVTVSQRFDLTKSFIIYHQHKVIQNVFIRNKNWDVFSGITFLVAGQVLKVPDFGKMLQQLGMYFITVLVSLVKPDR